MVETAQCTYITELTPSYIGNPRMRDMTIKPIGFLNQTYGVIDLSNFSDSARRFDRQVQH